MSPDPPIEIGPTHAELLTEIHAAAFAPDPGWDASAFATLLAPGPAPAWGLVAPDAAGMALLRTVAGETELLTVAVLPAHRGRGVATRLLAAAIARLVRPATLFLEVEADNVAALRLYRTLGFAAIATRTAYYGPGRDALVMRASRE